MVIVDVLENELKEVGEIIQKMGKRFLLMKTDVSDNHQVLDVIKKP